MSILESIAELRASIEAATAEVRAAREEVERRHLKRDAGATKPDAHRQVGTLDDLKANVAAEMAKRATTKPDAHRRVGALDDLKAATQCQISGCVLHAGHTGYHKNHAGWWFSAPTSPDPLAAVRELRRVAVQAWDVYCKHPRACEDVVMLHLTKAVEQVDALLPTLRLLPEGHVAVPREVASEWMRYIEPIDGAHPRERALQDALSTALKETP